MHGVSAHCCGWDVHKKTIPACLLISGARGKEQHEIRRFGTMTRDLLALADWLQSQQVTHGAMESTGVYWKPVWNILDGQVEVVLVNAQHIKAVPGRKTDTKDCQWIAELLQHGLLRGSFIPPPDPAVAGSDADTGQSAPGPYRSRQSDAEGAGGCEY